MIKKRKQVLIGGFTLLEVGIVIVIISLITGIMLVGSTVIRQAYLRKQISQIAQIESGMHNFYGKYSCVPGDCADPTVISGYTYSGNGNGYLESTWTNNENKGFWLHLTLTGMIDDTLITNSQIANSRVPKSAFNPQGVINAYGNIIYAQNVLEIDTTSISGVFKLQDIVSLDKKMDDGLAASGNVRPTGYGTGGNTVYVANPTFPLSTSTNGGSTQCLSGGVYSASATYDECNMIYILGGN